MGWGEPQSLGMVYRTGGFYRTGERPDWRGGAILRNRQGRNEPACKGTMSTLLKNGAGVWGLAGGRMKLLSPGGLHFHGLWNQAKGRLRTSVNVTNKLAIPRLALLSSAGFGS